MCLHLFERSRATCWLSDLKKYENTQGHINELHSVAILKAYPGVESYKIMHVLDMHVLKYVCMYKYDMMPFIHTYICVQIYTYI